MGLAGHAFRLLRPAIAGLGLLLLAGRPGVAMAEPSHCPTANRPDPASVAAAQHVVSQAVGLSRAGCDSCPDPGCGGLTHCVLGGGIALELIPAASLPIALVAVLASPAPPAGMPSFDPTPPTPPPNASSVR